jgi:lincosamide nucleotidyltransferase A/C/D/E
MVATVMDLPKSVVMMTARDVALVLDRLADAGIEAWVEGGWGVDALVGEQTRSHDDLDLIVRVDDTPTMCAVLETEGFRHVEGVLDSNFVLKDERGRSVDVHPVRFDEEGDGIYRMAEGGDWVFPAVGFRGTGHVGRRQVRCLTADVQMLCHATGYVPGATDFHDMRLLNARFGTELLPPFDGPSPDRDG